MQHPIVALLRALLLIVLTAAALAGAGNTLDIYFIDTEGGQATLLVSPSGETFMIDVGFAGLDTPNPDKDVGRDAARIADVAKTAKVGRIDTLLVTHFHGDHASGIAHLTLPVRTFVDHGPALQDAPTMKQKTGEYAEDWAAGFAKARHVVVTPGDKVAVKGLDVTVVEALGRPIARSGAANPYCTDIARRPDGNPEDTASVGVVVQYGRFRFANFGDLPWNQEVAMLCPWNRVGVATLQAFSKSPGFEDLWQLHKNLVGGAGANPADSFSANLEDTDNTTHPAHYLKVSATEDGAFTVFNSRTNETKHYAARR